MRIQATFLSGLALLGALSCKREKPAPPTTCPDTLSPTYTSYVEGVMRRHCTSCHGGATPSAGLRLETYAQVRQSAESGRWYAVMANGSMPPSGKLDECTLQYLQKWIEAGYPQ